jgi:ABC-type transport system involved in cytochrome bd biosynthesis fused ATPase/permease subunit
MALQGRDRMYLGLMAVCLTLFILAWAVVRNYSVTASVVMTVVALAIPPIAVIIANAGDEASRRR